VRGGGCRAFPFLEKEDGGEVRLQLLVVEFVCRRPTLAFVPCPASYG
jgi:hypothetical protein